jgi:hypothetical protein
MAYRGYREHDRYYTGTRTNARDAYSVQLPKTSSSKASSSETVDNEFPWGAALFGVCAAALGIFGCKLIVDDISKKKNPPVL